MDLTKGTEEEKRARSKKMMLWFAIISMSMMFAGLTSAYVVSKTRPDWLSEFELPSAFVWSTLIILLSSFTLHFAKELIVKNKREQASYLMWITLLLGAAFVYLQISGFEQILSEGFYFTGSASSITTTFVYLIVIAHLAHIFAGIIVLLVVIYNHYKLKYENGKTLGVELAATFWHFVDIVWIYLFLFLYFVK